MKHKHLVIRAEVKEPIVNKFVTERWREWLDSTGRTALPPVVICGNVAVIKKENDEAA